MRAYTFVFGYHERTAWYASDSHARKVAERWVRIFWGKLLKATPSGSIAHLMMTDDPTIVVYRHPWSPVRGMVGPGRLAKIASFAPESVLMDWPPAENKSEMISKHD